MPRSVASGRLLASRVLLAAVRTDPELRRDMAARPQANPRLAKGIEMRLKATLRRHAHRVQPSSPPLPVHPCRIVVIWSSKTRCPVYTASYRPLDRGITSVHATA